MLRNIGEFVFAVIICAIAAFGAVNIVTSCMGTGEAPPPGQRVLITEKGNVLDEAFITQSNGQANAVIAPVETLPGSIGEMVKDNFAGKVAVLTSEPWLKPEQIPGSTHLFLDVNGIYSLINQSAPELVTQLAGKVVPTAVAPWVGPLAMFLPLLFTNFRKNGVNAIKRVVPGVQSPVASESGKIPTISDFQKAFVDLAKAVTLHAPDPATVTPVTAPLNG